jgi:hypothetical protein
VADYYRSDLRRRFHLFSKILELEEGVNAAVLDMLPCGMAAALAV